MDPIDVFIVIMICVVPLLFVASLAGLGFSVLKFREARASLEKAELEAKDQESLIDDLVERDGMETLAAARGRILDLEVELAKSSSSIDDLEADLRAGDEVQQDLASAQKRIRDLEVELMSAASIAEELRLAYESEVQGRRSAVRQEEFSDWIGSMATREYLSEVEVEVKFIYPLVRFLGYSADQFNLRRTVALKMGSREAVGEADWVLWSRSHDGVRKPHAVIEAKSASQPLDDAFAAQARSYAFALGAPFYVVTNGRQLELYKRGVEMDERVLSVDATNIASGWKYLEEAIGRPNHEYRST